MDKKLLHAWRVAKSEFDSAYALKKRLPKIPIEQRDKSQSYDAYSTNLNVQRVWNILETKQEMLQKAVRKSLSVIDGDSTNRSVDTNNYVFSTYKKNGNVITLQR